MAEIIALGLVAAFTLQDAELAFILHALGKNRDRQAASQREHGAHDGKGLRAVFGAQKEGLVDLDLEDSSSISKGRSLWAIFSWRAEHERMDNSS